MADRKPPPTEPEQRKPGPDPERLKIEGPWEEAVEKALRKKKPTHGWPTRGRPRPDKKDS